MKKTLSLVLSLIMAITCVLAVPTAAFANKLKEAPTLKVGGTVKASISEKTDLKSDEDFYVKFVPNKTDMYEFYTENDSSFDKDGMIMSVIIDSKENLQGGAVGMLVSDPEIAALLDMELSLRVAAKLTAGKTYYFCISGMDYGTFSTEVHVKCGHKHSYSQMEIQAFYDEEDTEFCMDGSKSKVCGICGDTQTLETYYAPKKVELSKTSYSYDGKEKKPKVTVKDRKGNVISSKNYKIKYSNNKKVGTATATITFNDKKYTGVMHAQFAINPPKTSIKKLTAKKKGFKATWSKKTGKVDGYEIRYSTSSKMTGAKTAKVKGAKTGSKDIKKLKGNRLYYVQVRTYKKSGNKTYYSDWSDISKIKTKK